MWTCPADFAIYFSASFHPETLNFWTVRVRANTRRFFHQGEWQGSRRCLRYCSNMITIRTNTKYGASFSNQKRYYEVRNLVTASNNVGLNLVFILRWCFVVKQTYLPFTQAIKQGGCAFLFERVAAFWKSCALVFTHSWSVVMKQIRYLW